MTNVIVKTSPLSGIWASRQLSVYGDTSPPAFCKEPYVNWYAPEIFKGNFECVGKITITSQDLYKSITFGIFDHCLFETVFDNTNFTPKCLYTKIFTPQGCDILVSVVSARSYRDQNSYLIPVSNFIYGAESAGVRPYDVTMMDPNEGICGIVPAVLSIQHLSEYIHQIFKYKSRIFSPPQFSPYLLLFKNDPTTYDALITGTYTKTPLYQLHDDRGLILYPQPTGIRPGFHSPETSLTHPALINHPAFDSAVLDIVKLRFVEVGVLDSMRNISERLDGYNYTSYSDPYSDYFGSIDITQPHLRRDIQSILYKCLVAYCNLFQIDFDIYLEDTRHESTIHVHKDTNDDVVIIFNDVMTHNTVYCYSSFRVLALTTYAVAKPI